MQERCAIAFFADSGLRISAALRRRILPASPLAPLEEALLCFRHHWIEAIERGPKREHQAYSNFAAANDGLERRPPVKPAG